MVAFCFRNPLFVLLRLPLHSEPMSHGLHMLNQGSRVRWRHGPYRFQSFGHNTYLNNVCYTPAEFGELLAVIDGGVALHVHCPSIVLDQIEAHAAIFPGMI